MTTPAPTVGTAAVVAALQAHHDGITPGGMHPHRGWNDIHRDGMRDGVKQSLDLVTKMAAVPVSAAAQDKAAAIESRLDGIWESLKYQGEEGWQVDEREFARAALVAFSETPTAWLINDGNNPPYPTIRQVDADEAREEGWDVQPLVLAVDFTPKAKPKAAP